METSEAARETDESHTETQAEGRHAHIFHDVMNRCELVIGHRARVKHDEWMHGDLYNSLMLKLQSCVSYRDILGEYQMRWSYPHLLRPEGTTRFESH